MTGSNNGNVYFCGNGDVYSHVDYFDAVNNANVDAAMIGRGALIKPWIFEEIQTGQYLDKSASERLQYIEQFTRFGLENWGSDEIGVGVTRRFLLEWLSFSCRYVPIGLLEHLPAQMNDRPPAFRGRNELETLLSSANYKDWIKIRQVHDVMFLKTESADKILVKCSWDRHTRTSSSSPSTRATATRLRLKVKRCWSRTWLGSFHPDRTECVRRMIQYTHGCGSLGLHIARFISACTISKPRSRIDSNDYVHV
jgi:hypothetical protein